MCSKGKHGDLIMRSYHEQGRAVPDRRGLRHASDPVHDRGAGNPYGKNEYDAAGGLLGEPVEVITGPRPACRFPRTRRSPSKASCIRTISSRKGRSANGPAITPAGSKKEPAIRIETFMYRNDPILMGAIPGIPPDDDSFYRGTYRSGAVWNQLEAAGHSRGQGRVGA